MTTLWRAPARTFLALLLLLAAGHPLLAQTPGTPAPATPAPPKVAPALISLAEARAIVDAAVAFAREQKICMAVAVVDQSGNLVSSDRMDECSPANTALTD